MRNLFESKRFQIPSLVSILALGAACAAKAPVEASAEAPAEAAQTQSFPDGTAKPNTFWWPEQVDLSPLRANAEAG